MMRNSKKNSKKYMKALSNIFLWTRHTHQWCNMLQTLERRRKYIGAILPDEHTHPHSKQDPQTLRQRRSWTKA